MRRSSSVFFLVFAFLSFLILVDNVYSQDRPNDDQSSNNALEDKEREARNILSEGRQSFCSITPFLPFAFPLSGISNSVAKKFVEEKLVTLYLALLQSLFKAPSELERVGDLFLRNFLSSKAFIVSLVLCILTLILVLSFLAAQAKCVRKLFAFCFCRVFCLDRPRAEMEFVDSWKKGAIALVLFIISFLMFFICLILLVLSSVNVDKSVNMYLCQSYRGTEGLIFGEGYEENKTTSWPGLELLKNGEKYLDSAFLDDYKKSITNIRDSNTQGVRRSRDLAAKISVTAGDIEDFARKHEQHYVVNDVLKDNADAAEQKASTRLLEVDDYFKDNVTNSAEIESGVNNAASGLRQIRSVVYSVVQSVGLEPGKTLKYWKRIFVGFLVGVCVLGFVVGLVGWIVSALWGVSAWKLKQPSSRLAAATTGAYVTHGIFAFVVVIITSLFFIVSMYTTSTCQTVKVLVDNPIMLFDMLPIQNETETRNNLFYSNSTMKCPTREEVETFLDPQLTSVTSKLDEWLQDPSMLELDEFVELQRISEETSWIVLLNKNVDLPAQISWQTVKTTDTAVNKLLETSGIQETTRHFNCADAVGDLKKLCDALITEIVGLDDFQEELNKRVDVGKTKFCITAKQCMNYELRPVVNISNWDELKQDYTETAIALAYVAQLKERLRQESLLCLKGPGRCTVSTTLGLEPDTHQSIPSVTQEAFADVQEVFSDKTAQSLVREISSFSKKAVGAVYGNTTLNCGYVFDIIKENTQTLCSGAVPSVAFYGSVLCALWALSLVSMVAMFTVWHFARDTIHVPPLYEGHKPDDVIIDNLSTDLL